MGGMKPIATDIYTFSNLIGGGYLYVDKTGILADPVSLGRCFADGEFRQYWYETGTPTFLVNMLKERPIDISSVEVTEEELGTYEPSNPSLVPLLYQTGYLTIKKFDQVGETRLYTLGFPNMEVEKAFCSFSSEKREIDGFLAEEA